MRPDTPPPADPGPIIGPWLAWLARIALRVGVPRATAVLVGLSVVASVGLTAGWHLAAGWTFSTRSLLMSALVPIPIASVCAWFTLRLVVALEIALGRVEDMAMTDPLTGVRNRRYFMQVAAREFDRAARHGQPMALVLIDVDHFKRINDAHGHLVGDAALRGLGAVLRRELREGDLVGRFGGEEFVVLLRGLEPLEAQAVAERLRQAIAAEPIEYQGARHAMTASLGLAVVARREGLEAALGRADAALYAAKHAGRDRVRVAPVPESAGATGSSPGVARA